MKDFLKYVPGFRSNKLWKKIVAMIYYLMALTAILDSIWTFIAFISMPFLIFSFMNLIKKRKSLRSTPKIILPFIVSLLIFSFAGNLMPPTTVESEKQSLISEQKEEPNVEPESLELEEAEKDEEGLRQESKLKEERIENERIEAERVEIERIATEEKAKKEELELAEKLKKEDEEAAQLAIVNANKDNSTSVSGGSSTVASTQTGQGEVFVTATGSKYHRQACGKGNYSATTLENAKSSGLEPCKKCY